MLCVDLDISGKTRDTPLQNGFQYMRFFMIHIKQVKRSNFETSSQGKCPSCCPTNSIKLFVTVQL